MLPHAADSPDTRRDTTPTSRDTSRPETLGVAAAALALGLSPRTIQRQCRAGKLSARRVQSDFGEQWEIERAAVERAATKGPTVTPTEAATPPRHVAPVSHPKSAATPAQTEAGADLAARYLARLETENDFLRATVEQHQRSEAELRAALREALKATPRALTTGSREVAPIGPESTPGREIRAGEPEAAAPSSGPQIAPEAAETGAADFAEIDALIHKVFK